MRTSSVKALNPQGFHKVVYHEWGSADNDRVLVCVHGLARNSRDFDDLALALSRDYRVICPDIVGRGESDWLPQGVNYDLPRYMSDMVTLLARLNVEQVDWVGTSMGGLIGICLAALPGSPIRSLVLNDIGTHVSKESLQRIVQYLGDHRFASLAELEQYMRNTYTAYAGLSDKQWQHLVQSGHRKISDTEYGLHYDPRLVDATREAQHQDVDLEPFWNMIQCPQMLIWGQDSDVLTEETVARMRQQRPDMDLYQIPGMSHAPSLMEEDQIKAVQLWLRNNRNKNQETGR
ncbi:alpha/beta fold hydrolase [Amphritea balenae]|uniref:Alpha/beta hydrolase n=1 Tax=Amphritea balenae TaxID=452629 RepID=A0A3P1SRA0_9GAMM|nr:alpha/beta hydrolase [Amphritea balenae]RRC99688.1 alpha/beta hydrolase [Amphritea balenae]GGK78993.1 alpha/beta hydrolase [Amphritea balenae]